MHLQNLTQIEFATSPNAEIREYDTILASSDIEALTSGYIGMNPIAEPTIPTGNENKLTSKSY